MLQVIKSNVGYGPAKCGLAFCTKEQFRPITKIFKTPLRELKFFMLDQLAFVVVIFLLVCPRWTILTFWWTFLRILLRLFAFFFSIFVFNNFFRHSLLKESTANYLTVFSTWNWILALVFLPFSKRAMQNKQNRRKPYGNFLKRRGKKLICCFDLLKSKKKFIIVSRRCHCLWLLHRMLSC